MPEPRKRTNSKDGKFKKDRKPRDRDGMGAGMPRGVRPIPTYDYKNTELLMKFVTEKGKILPRRITRLNAKDQRTLKKLIRKARHAALMPFQVY
jgi:small subunit ribosomal protein S18